MAKPPQTVVNNYKRGIKLYEEGKGGDGLESSTVRKAREIAKGGSVSDEWIRKANRWWGRNKRFLKEPSDSPAYVSALLWGGSAGRDWYQSQYRKLENNMQKLIFCTQRVNQDMIRRENRQGVEHIVLTSFTLPPNIVMNGGLYPEDEVEKSFNTLNRTPVTVGHPEIDGNYVSANDPEIDMDYRFGAFNENAKKMPDGRIQLDKVINVQKALKTDKGKRLLDRLSQLEKNADAEPIHTSVGVYVDAEDTAEPMINGDGQEYNWIARNMFFDHDAILLDEVGAATPDQGTGIGINSGQKVKVIHCNLDELANNELSFSEIGERIQQALMEKYANTNNPPSIYVEYGSIKSSEFVYCEDGKYYKSTYEVDANDNLSVNDSNRIEVQRKTEYIPVNEAQENENNQQPQSEDNAMRDSIIAELESLGIKVNADISDADLQAKYKEALTADNNGDDALKANQELLDTVSNLEARLKANEEKELTDKIKTIKANKSYSELSEETLKIIANNNSDEFEKMHASSIPSHDIGSTHYKPNANESVDDSMFAINAEA